MPTSPTYPGVYIEELPSIVRTIAGVPTSITAFVGRTRRGPSNQPVRVQSFAEFERQFGGIWRESTLSYAVQQFFQNGGVDAIVVRVHNGATAATLSLPASAGGPNIELGAGTRGEPNEGTWGNRLRVLVDHDTRDASDLNLFNLTIQELAADGTVATEEVHRNVSISTSDPRDVARVLREQSSLVRVTNGEFTSRPAPAAVVDATAVLVNVNGADGGIVSDAHIAAAALQDPREGIYALDDADLFNILCIPPYDRDNDVAASTWNAAKAYCRDKRAILIVDPPSSWRTHQDVDPTAVADTSHRDHAALYFPRVRIPDPLQENRSDTFAPCGVVAGIYSRTDRERGVWKAPAGQEATLAGVRELTYTMTDGQNGQLNPLGVNCLRRFPAAGHVIWGGRTMEGDDRLASQWKYVPVRRLALFIEESLYRGTQWVIFEPNDEPLWAQIRLNVGAFMHNLFRQGAFQGSSPRQAYFVKCDKDSNPQNDIDRGIVNLLVGFAPLKPAEFLIIKISQIAGELQT